MLQKKVGEKIKTCILYSVILFGKSCRLCEILGCSRTAHRKQHNTAHVLCMLGKEGNRHTLRTCNTHCFPTASIVTRRLLNTTFTRRMLLFLKVCLISNTETCWRKL